MTRQPDSPKKTRARAAKAAAILSTFACLAAVCAVTRTSHATRGREAVGAAASAVGEVAPSYDYPFQNPDLPAERRIDNLLSLMTLEEKVACLGTNPSVPRLGVKGSGHSEGLHGLAQAAPPAGGASTRRRPPPSRRPSAWPRRGTRS